MNIAEIDLNVLVVFDAMHQHLSVTRAGQALGLSQPAMSAALAKLRAQLGDPLFVRTGHGMRPTPRALQLVDPVKRILETVRADILLQPAFDPATAQRSFTVITPDIGELVFVPKILAYNQRHAPGVTIHSVAISSPGAGEALASGEADLAIGYFPDLAKPGFYQQRLFRNSFVCVVRADHPRIQDHPTLDQFLAESHAVVRPAGRTHLYERFLESQNIRRSVRAELAHFASLLTIITTSDLIATVPRDIAHVFAGLAPIRLVDPPLQPPAFHLKQHWHERVHADAANVWLRKLVRDLFHD
ncbi:transcriptional regulator, LysR family [Noviherbaspirillum humi]|uniref:Transcriptional regulator, LysR family n=1 Tax=Noviherbaspirillum humi TaxID=1688639 RepID=A0A239LXR8_9BURK|nr:LysR family transcriptional regulator [Noviherbaspirillum humi]SNT34762.1 transcriptional regulator, LysR family [Noviherbaspirillum humi]